MAARRYPGLSAIVVLAAVLIALGWLGFATHDEPSGRHTANQHLAAARVALEHETVRVHALSARLERAALIAGRQRATAIAATASAVRARAAERKLTQARRRHHHRAAMIKGHRKA